ncbi:MAG TPA: tetratricopeptide repeat protein [Planctomycetes bacterium]|nr:tetratricopeptide repeat protein [Planctomycetota bacterium]
MRCLLLSIAIALACCGFSPPLSAQSQNVDALNKQVAQLFKAGDYVAAVPLAEQALALSGSLPPDHLSTATANHNLGELYRVLDRTDEAEPLMLKALDIRGRVLGSADASYIATLSNLGGLYVQQHRYEEAEQRFHEAIETQLKSPSATSRPALGRSFNDLAYLYRTLERSRDSEQIYRLALKVLETGPPSLPLAATLDNLAELYQSLSRGVEAEPLFKRSLRISRQVTNPKHESVGVSLCNHDVVAPSELGRRDVVVVPAGIVLVLQPHLTVLLQHPSYILSSAR